MRYEKMDSRTQKALMKASSVATLALLGLDAGARKVYEVALKRYSESDLRNTPFGRRVDEALGRVYRKSVDL